MRLLVQALIDPGDLGNPALPLAVLQRHDLLIRPMKVIGDVGYLLVEPVEGVAYDSPDGRKSTSKLVEHDGHVTVIFDAPGSLIRW